MDVHFPLSSNEVSASFGGAIALTTAILIGTEVAIIQVRLPAGLRGPLSHLQLQMHVQSKFACSTE